MHATDGDIASKLPRMRLPDSLTLGLATSATQIEGSSVDSDWEAFASTREMHRPSTNPLRSWNEWKRDVELLRELRAQSYRMSIEWARIEPAPYAYDVEAVERYGEQLTVLRRAGVTPMLTMLHFTLPLWLADRGGVLAPDFTMHFERFTRHCAKWFGHFCELYVTVNEPSVMGSLGYIKGVWPPGSRGAWVKYLRSQRALLNAHRAAYASLKRELPHAQIGIAHHIRAVAPASTSPADRLAAATYRRLAHSFAFASCRTPCQDFFGINYYTLDVVDRHGVVPYAPSGHRNSDGTATDMGWRVHPDGLTAACTAWAQRSKLPIIITENGIADAADKRRPAFLRDHLRAVVAATATARIRGYYHWTLCDNYEWAWGYEPTARFGLFDAERRARPSATLFGRIITEREV
jgi:beta-glucosidase